MKVTDLQCSKMYFLILLCFVFGCVSHLYGLPAPVPILGGEDAEGRKYEYQVSLQHIARNNRHYCGGSIISDSWILTAAHCLDNNRIKKDATQIRILAGTISLKEKGDEYFVQSYMLHEKWDNRRIANDVAVLKTIRKIRFSTKVKAIPLATVTPPDGTIANLAGWGLTRDDDTSSASNILQTVSFAIISLKECRDQFNRAAYPGSLVIESNICVLQPKGKGQCNGDSGGALRYNGTQIGIVSFGGVCSDGVPGVFTSIVYYLDWIIAKTSILN